MFLKLRVRAALLFASLFYASSVVPLFAGSISGLTFSPDGKDLAFSYCSSNECSLQIHELGKGKKSVLTPSNGDRWLSPSYSPNGQQLAFVIQPQGTDQTKIALIDIRSEQVKILVDPSAPAFFPTFSLDGRRLIFIKSLVRRKLSRMRFGGHDFYEVEIETKKIKQLTKIMCGVISGPYYMPEGNSFVASAGWCSWPRAKLGWETVNDEGIYLFSSTGGQEKRIEIKIDQAMKPSLSSDGEKILFTGISNKLDGYRGKFRYDVFLYNSGHVKRLTNAGGVINMAVISPDGKRFAYTFAGRQLSGDAIHIECIAQDCSYLIELSKK